MNRGYSIGDPKNDLNVGFIERLQLLRGGEWVVADAVQGQVLGAFDDQAVLAAVAVYTSSGF